MTTTRTTGIVPSRLRSALPELFIIFFILSLVSCSFDLPWDRTVTDGSQKRTTKTDTVQAQPGSQPLPELSSSTGDGGRKWSRYMTDDNDTKYFYDEDAIIYSSKNIIQMWRKREFPPGAAQKEIVTLDEIDCGKAEYRTLELRVTRRDGITERSDKATRWAKIYENSSEAYIMGQRCK